MGGSEIIIERPKPDNRNSLQYNLLVNRSGEGDALH